MNFGPIHHVCLFSDCSVQPCLNGGSCEDRGDSFVCTCAPGYTGVYCEQEISAGRWPIDWLIDWLIDRLVSKLLIDQSVDCFIDWLMKCLLIWLFIDSLIDQSVDCLITMVDLIDHWLIDWMVNWLMIWLLIDCLINWLIDRLIGLMIGWSIDWLIDSYLTWLYKQCSPMMPRMLLCTKSDIDCLDWNWLWSVCHQLHMPYNCPTK